MTFIMCNAMQMEDFSFYDFILSDHKNVKRSHCDGVVMCWLEISILPKILREIQQYVLQMHSPFSSTSWSPDRDDVRVTHGFITLKPNSQPPEVSIMSTGNEGLNMIELGTLQNHVATFNVSYMQVHPAMDNDVLPLGVRGFFVFFTWRWGDRGACLTVTNAVVICQLIPEADFNNF